MRRPAALLRSLRPSLPAGVLLAMAFITFALAASPFLFAPLAEAYDISFTTASLVAVFQLGGFVAGAWLAGRVLLPRRRVLVAGLVAAVVTNGASALLPVLPVLIGLRFLSGLVLGVLSWFAWVQVFGDDRGTGEMAVIGPVTGIAASPLIAVFADRGGAAAVFGLLAVLALVPLVFNRGTGASHRVPPRSGRSRPILVAKVVLGALGLFTLGGSSVFQYVVVLGIERLGMTASSISIVLSVNAAASIPSARWSGNRGHPGFWVIVTGMCAMTMTMAPRPAVYAAAIAVWGFAFWMAVPGVFSVLASRSRHPADRAGDAQAVMAAGRVVGPLVGAAVLDVGGSVALGIVGGSLMIVAGLIVAAVGAFTGPFAAGAVPHDPPGP